MATAAARLEPGLPVCRSCQSLSRLMPSNLGFDQRKVGRRAECIFAIRLAPPSKISSLPENPWRRNRELNEAGSRSCFREDGPTFSLLVPQSTHESAAAGQDIETKMPEDHPDPEGLFASGGGVKGALAGHV